MRPAKVVFMNAAREFRQTGRGRSGEIKEQKEKTKKE